MHYFSLSSTVLPLLPVHLVFFPKISVSSLARLEGGHDNAIADVNDEAFDVLSRFRRNPTGNVLVTNYNHVHSLFLVNRSNSDGPVEMRSRYAALLHSAVGVVR